MKKIFKGLSFVLSFLLLCLSIFQFGNFNAIAEDVSTNKAFYWSPYHANPRDMTVVDGLETNLRYEVTKKDGTKEYSTNSWINTDWSYSTKIGKRGDFLDINQVDAMAQEVHIKNTTAADMPFNIRFTYPRKEINDAGYFAPKVSGEPVVENTDTSNTINFNISGLGVNTLDAAKADASTDWSSLSGMTISGTLGAGKEINITTPLVIENIDTIENVYFSSDIYYTTPNSATRYVTIRGAKSIYNVNDLIYGNYVGTYLFYYRDDTGAKRSVYVRVPDEIQAVMPEVKRSDLWYTLWDYIGLIDTDNKPYPSDEAAFWLSDYAIRLTGQDSIFERVSPLGYSVLRQGGANPTKVRDNYFYSLGNRGLVILDEEGNPTTIGRVDEHGFNLSRFYVELAQLLDTKDIKLNVNGAWSDFDNLTYHMKVHSPGENPDVEIPLESLATSSNVDVTVPGTYTVKYSYDVGNDKKPDETSKDIVSRTAKVDVVATRLNITRDGISDEDDRPIVIEILKDGVVIDTINLDESNDFDYSSALLNRFDEASGENFKYGIRVLAESGNFDVVSDFNEENNILELNFNLSRKKATDSKPEPVIPPIPNGGKATDSEPKPKPNPDEIKNLPNGNGGSGSADSAGGNVIPNRRPLNEENRGPQTDISEIKPVEETKEGQEPIEKKEQSPTVLKKTTVPKTSDSMNKNIWIISFLASLVFLNIGLFIKTKEEK